MDASQLPAYQKLLISLEEMTKLYRSLLDVVRKEKDFLIAADIEKLNENNKNKETLIYKIRALDASRERLAKEVGKDLGLPMPNPRLMEIAQKVSSAEAEKLRNVHATLEIIVKRVSDLNKENEQYTQSALKNLNGAMNEIKETLSGKHVYERKGKKAYGPDQAGNFVSKEA